MTKNIVVTAVVALVVSVLVGLFFTGQSSQSSTLGGLSERDIQAVSLSVGTQGTTKGTPLTFIKKGTMTCNSSFIGSAAQVGSTTIALDCSVTGARSGDTVLIGRPTGMTSTWFYVGAYASTTANDYVRAILYNNTGTTSNGAPSTATSSIPYVLIRS